MEATTSEQGGLNERLRKPIAQEMGLQVSRGVHPEVPTEEDFRHARKIEAFDSPAALPLAIANAWFSSEAATSLRRSHTALGASFCRIARYKGGAVAIDETGHIDVAVDWKSDVNRGAKQIAMYRRQVLDYLESTGAKSGLLVILGSGRLERVAWKDRYPTV